MSKFTVIAGGGREPPDRTTGQARYHLAQAIIEILRSLARGYEVEGRVTHQLIEFFRAITKMDAPADEIVSDVIAELHKDLDHGLEQPESLLEQETIVLRALQVAAEAMADDPGAKGRLSKRQSHLSNAIEHQFIRREIRRQEQGRLPPRSPEEAKADLKKIIQRLRNPKHKSKKPPGDDSK